MHLLIMNAHNAFDLQDVQFIKHTETNDKLSFLLC